MKPSLPVVTGIGSVTPFGPLAGVVSMPGVVSTSGMIAAEMPEPREISAWKTAGLRRAFLVEPFHPASIVPGVKTRRLDTLSAWALVASSLALRDAGIDLATVDRSRVAVFFATGFGCADLAHSFFRGAAANGWAGTDPITFPETLSNAPAAHVALFHDLRGPNVTIGSEGFAAENALLQASSMLRHGQADLAIVMAGDALTQAVYEWYEVAHLLSPLCFTSDPVPRKAGFIPSEGVVAMVLEPEGRSEVRRNPAQRYLAVGAGCCVAGGDARTTVRRLLGDARPQFIFCAGNGAPGAISPLSCRACDLIQADAAIYPAQPVAAGLGATGGLFHLLMALSQRPGSGEALLLGTAANGGHAALRLELF